MNLLTYLKNQAHYPPPNPIKNGAEGWWSMSRGIGKVCTVGRASKSKSQRWRIRLSNGLDIYCDKDGKTFYSREHAEGTLDLIRSEMHPDHYRFDPDSYKQRKESRRTFRSFAESWLENVELKTERGEYSPGYLKALKGYIYNHWLPHFKDEDIREIRGQQLNKFLLASQPLCQKSMELYGSTA